MGTVVLDEKGRITLPAEFREAWNLKPKQRLVLKRKGKEALLKPVGKVDAMSDPLLRRFVLHPLKGPRVTRKELEEIENAMWLP